MDVAQQAKQEEQAIQVELAPKIEARLQSRPSGDEASKYPVHSLVMLVTEECNLRCDYCYIRKQPRVMSQATAEQAIDFLFANTSGSSRPLSITFFGGEPLLEPKMVEYIHSYASDLAAQKKREINFNMTTNATLFTAKNTALVKRLGITVRLSLDGIGEAHDRHRKTIAGKGSFHLIERQLERISQLKNVSVRLTVTPETAPMLLDSFVWLKQHGFSSISFSTVTEANWDETSLGHLLEAQKELYKFQQKSVEISVNHIGKTNRMLASPGQRWGCGAARGFAAVDTQGYLYPCHRFIGYFKNGLKQRIGHVETGFFGKRRESYLAANYSATRRGCGHGLFPAGTAKKDRICANCKLLPVCGSNCIAVNEHMTGDPAKPHPINRVLAQMDTAVHLNTIRRT